MGVASGCGCKEVYRFPHITYPYFLFIFLMFYVLVTVLFVIYVIIFSPSINTHTGDYRHPTEAI